MASPRQPCNQPFYAFYQVPVEHFALWPPGTFYLRLFSLQPVPSLLISTFFSCSGDSLTPHIPTYTHILYLVSSSNALMLWGLSKPGTLKPTLSTSWLTYIYPAIGASPIFLLSSGYFLCAPWLQALLSTWVEGVRWNFWSPKKLPELDREDKMVPTATGCSSQVRWP